MATQPILDTAEKVQNYINVTVDGWIKTNTQLTQATLSLENMGIQTLNGIKFPEDIQGIQINNNPINTLDSVSFPDKLQVLIIRDCKITSLENVKFPSQLGYLNIIDTPITTLKGVVFPNRLTSLYIAGNNITSFEGMQFPLSLASFHLERNLINPDTITLLKRPTENVMREIVRNYPQTAAYFESQRELEELNMRKLQNHVRSIATFLQPLIAVRKATEEAKLPEGKPRLFVTGPVTRERYIIPFDSKQTVQSAIDYLEQNYLLSVTNSCAEITLMKDKAKLNPALTFANTTPPIQNEDTLTALASNSYNSPQQGGRKQTKHNKLKIKTSRSRKYKRPFH
jgi:hypothetical protein